MVLVQATTDLNEIAHKHKQISTHAPLSLSVSLSLRSLLLSTSLINGAFDFDNIDISFGVGGFSIQLLLELLYYLTRRIQEIHAY